MSFSALSLRAKIHSEGTETEKRLASLLFDETIQVMSTFEMNQIASLSYGDEPCEQIFDLLTEVMAHPMEFSVLSVEKALVISRHLLIYGSEKTVNSCWALGSYVSKLCEFNTVLLAQQQQGIGSWWNSVKGGAVDKGFPVREAAKALSILIGDAARIQQLRNDNADPNSLVPVGSSEKLGFVSDEMRHYMLQKRMKEQSLQLTRSNLVKSEGGFGAGFNAANGQTVVGAAHTYEEMLARAERESRKFTETGPIHYKPPPRSPTTVEHKKHTSAPPIIDLLDLSAPLPVPAASKSNVEVDLLGFENLALTSAPAPQPTMIDIFSSPAPVSINAPVNDLIGGYPEILQIPQKDPFSGDLMPIPSAQNTSDILNLLSLPTPPLMYADVSGSDGLLNMVSAATSQPDILSTAPKMASNVDKFSVFDDITPTFPVNQSNIYIRESIEPAVALPPIPDDAPPPLPSDPPPPPPIDGYDSNSKTGLMLGGSGITPLYGAQPIGGFPVMLGEVRESPFNHIASSTEYSQKYESNISVFGEVGSTIKHDMMSGTMAYRFDPPGHGGLSSGGNLNLTQMSYPSELPPPPPIFETSSLSIAPKYGDISDENSGFFMGGSSGTGL
jgi:ENTH domain